MAPTTPQLAFRQAGWKMVGYSSSPGEKQYKGAQYNYIQHRSSQHPASGLAASLYSPKTFSTGFRPTSALPDQLGATTAAVAPETAVDSSVDLETVRLVTAAAILSQSDSGSDTDTAEAYTSIDEDADTLTDPLAFLDELTTLDAGSLSLAIGILRQHQPVDVEEADVLLSERLRDLLLLLHQRPFSTPSSRSISRSASPAFGSHTSSNPGSAVSTTDEADGFWAGRDEWSDVRSALMSIGIDASLDDDEDDDDEDVWTMEEEGPARRTRLLRSLPRLTPDTAQQLADLLASLRQPGAAASELAGSQHSSAESTAGGTAAADEVWSEEDANWWEEVTQAYHMLWQQAKLQQAK